MSIELAIVLVGSYLLGSVPFGLVFTKLAGLGDIREMGSGNIGATNVLRTGRKDLALATLLLDAGKGAIAVLLTRYLADEWMAVYAGMAAFMGHCFPVYLKFKGGKGVATFIGTLLAISPVMGAATVGAWLLSALVFRISSLSALIAAVAAPIINYVLVGGNSWMPIAFMTAMIYYRHQENIGRILKGEEPKIGKKK
ncbi:glycerol-3-phosphate 1-O-acyltransferase PlsY [Kordiimonas sp. SCSIO 12603]|uniref:glycerol-3-phosphate 1-O-acyltransferase PlsY n=1 Tax=Kordiimonas sp. SCSIO 12603 TaxID=2829596 RepID=UPI0021081CCA|nr:glycerol-3-phosphate 1-O-acyltransferase PlsY [Kordiimonas sp. SCSIO 12603]UTW57034.1 glycerol-3-phosphate 1-O-acyltransferase PlsY [Kordiimonas sp. SCSIO 12603]